MELIFGAKSHSKGYRVITLSRKRVPFTPFDGEQYEPTRVKSIGASAVRAPARGRSGVMVALQVANIRTVPLEEAIVSLKTIPPESQLVRTARDVGISFGAPDEDSFHQAEGRNQL